MAIKGTKAQRVANWIEAFTKRTGRRPAGIDVPLQLVNALRPAEHQGLIRWEFEGKDLSGWAKR